MSLEIRRNPLPYAQRLESRSTDEIDLVVIHCTELPDLAMARVWGEKELYPETRTGNSGHFYIDRAGRIEQWVPLEAVAHHVRGFNPKSIGIELINIGRYPDWFRSGHQQMEEPYPEPQVEALVILINHLQKRVDGLKKIAGHEDLDTAMIPSEDDPNTLIRRKLDPGPLFPWAVVMNKIQLERVVAKDL